MRLCALGPLEALSSGRPVKLGGAKPKALVAALLLEARQVVSVDRLVDLIWDDEPPKSAVALVHTYVSTLRRVFASHGESAVLVTRPPGYALLVEPSDIDVEEFAEGLRAALVAERELDHQRAAALYEQALGLWRGPVFGGVDASFVRFRADALEADRLSAQEGLARCELEIGRVASAASRMAVVTAAHPYREGALGLLMRAQYQSGRQSEALATYRTGRERLIAELGVEPGDELRDLHEQVLRGTLPVPAEKVRGLRSESVGPNQLPPDVVHFTGRAEQVDQLTALSRTATKTATVVISGVGGAGKSALAVHCAHRLAPEFPGGQLFADMHRAGRTVDAVEVLSRFLRVLGVSSADLPEDADERVELYRMTVAQRRLVVVLDNVRDERQVRMLLPGSGRCLLIITSRSRLTGIAGAASIELDLFSRTESVELLSRIVGQDRLSADLDSVSTITRLCGGIPLAIQVAGAKLLARPHWPLQAMAVRLLDKHRRLDELAVGDLAIRSSLELHYSELTAVQRRAFHLLTLLDLPDFGSWVAAPLLDIGTGEAEDVVEQLVDLRLVDVAGVDSLGHVRYRFHDLVQLFGADRASATEPVDVVAEAIGRTLATWRELVQIGAARLPRVTLGLSPVSRSAVEVDPKLVADVESSPTEWFASETTAVVRAVERAYELGVDELTTRLITSLLVSPFATRNEFDGWQRTHEVALGAARKSGNRRDEASLLASLGQLFYEKDDFAAALGHFQDSLEHATAVGDDAIRAVALVGIGTVQRDRGQFAAAYDSLTEAAGPADRVEDRSVTAAVKYGLGVVFRDRGDLDAAEGAFHECVDAYREAGDLRGQALAVRGLSLCRRAAGRAAEAADLSRQAVDLLTEAGDRLGATYARQSLSKALIRQGRLSGVREVLSACLDVCTAHRDRFGIALVTRTAGELALAENDLALAQQLLTSASELWRELELAVWDARTQRDLAAAKASSDPVAAHRHWAAALDVFRAAGSREAAELASTTPREWFDRIRLQTGL
ncbi:hypothetical protein BBK82_08385 [Lentzea guizhouensis]|uniref:OmpR/PhoB-type domain-containing protein n=1 Tax=Lentzea guizhouensis TaxID=1586287 RepID=A0A1B2HED3_9PSEU|nr:AfsR/SARP family transcriptional regulator [Lentzea guizhouensis]ANZ36084.1 hypothetical protein BBK82_08385 [Lentzea guizhouensis]